MVKVLFLGLLVAMMCGLVSAVPAPQLARSIRPEVFPSSPTIPSSPVLEDPATRSERSTNLSYITGTARKIQLFIKNRHLQLLSDGTVNGTTNASSAYSRRVQNHAGDSPSPRTKRAFDCYSQSCKENNIFSMI